MRDRKASQAMLTAEQCLAHAIDCDKRALACDQETLSAEIREMSEIWRHIARQAEWQDAFTLHLWE
jgi:hypothetical protein